MQVTSPPQAPVLPSILLVSFSETNVASPCILAVMDGVELAPVISALRAKYLVVPAGITIDSAVALVGLSGLKYTLTTWSLVLSAVVLAIVEKSEMPLSFNKPDVLPQAAILKAESS